MPPMRTRRISFDGYAQDERLPDANTARAVGRPNVSWASRSLWSGLPKNAFFSR